MPPLFSFEQVQDSLQYCVMGVGQEVECGPAKVVFGGYVGLLVENALDKLNVSGLDGHNEREAMAGAQVHIQEGLPGQDREDLQILLPDCQLDGQPFVRGLQVDVNSNFLDQEFGDFQVAPEHSVVDGGPSLLAQLVEDLPQLDVIKLILAGPQRSIVGFEGLKEFLAGPSLDEPQQLLVGREDER